MVVGIFSWASSYNTKLREMRKIGQNSRKIMNMISDDLRQANGSATIYFNSEAKDIGEYAIVTCPSDWIADCKIVENYQSIGDSGVNFDNNNRGLLIVNRKKEKVVFYRLFESGGLKRKEIGIKDDSESSFAFSDLGTVLGQSLINSEDSVDIKIGFAGYTPLFTNRKSQPFIKIKMLTETENYDITQNTYRAKLNLETTVTSRDYNIFE